MVNAFFKFFQKSVFRQMMEKKYTRENLITEDGSKTQTKDNVNQSGNLEHSLHYIETNDSNVCKGCSQGVPLFLNKR